MALADVFFTPSILITLAICLILISALGLFFIQKFNQQNHKLNTMFDLVNTLAQEIQMMKLGSIPTETRTQEAGDIGQSVGGSGPILDVAREDTPTRDPVKNISLIEVSDRDYDDEDSDVHISDDSEEDSDDDDDDDDDDESVDSDDEDDEDDDEDDEDDEDDKDSEKSLDKDATEATLHSTDDIPILEKKDDVFTFNDASTIDDILTSTVDIQSTDVEDAELTIQGEDFGEGIKNIDVVVDYKKASIGKLREIAEGKGLVTDASKMKKNELLRLLDSL